MENINEDCGCGGSSEITEPHRTYEKHPDPLLGKSVKLVDGRSGVVDDSIRNSRGEVIGYVIEGSRGNFRVFKDKISSVMEQMDAMASLDSVPGMGEVQPPTRTSTGSGDQFPTLTVGTQAAKPKKKGEKSKSDSIMGFADFIKKSRKNQ